MSSSVALLGMSCRFPGGINCPEELWRLVSEEGDAIGGLPDDRGWEIQKLYNPEPGDHGGIYVKRGYFLRDIYHFDADFFGMSPREAKATDPQQRIALELAWEALERAGVDPVSLRGTRAGVFVGASNNSYYWLSPGTTSGDLDRYWGTGTTTEMISGRIAYALGLEGPAMTVNTGCSSALVALHLARQSLILGECDLAIVGGITVMAHPDNLVYFSGQRALAPDGTCKPFAAGADGTSFADGAGMLVLERLPDARQSGHPVLAVVKGSALSHDGATSKGLTAPSTHAQRQAILAALRDARLSARDIDAVEAHGTGTLAGDPVEASALIDVYAHERDVADPLWIGSVKSNIGHTQWAAGVAGIIKMVLAMKNKALPKTLHVDRPAPDAGWDRGAVRLLTQSVPWPERARRRRAGVSAFGISGTNAHVILEAPPRDVARRAVALPAAGPVSPVTPILLSAKTEAALHDQARRLAEHPSASAGGVSISDLGYALATTRSTFEHRAVILATEKRELGSRLRALAAGEPAPGVITGTARQPGKIVFVFPGQGAQWPGMASALVSESPVFARQLAACDDALAPYADWSLMDVLRRGPDQAALDRLDVIQPVLFALAVSLAALWRSLGVEPEAVVGHSQGEVAAAYACGALSLDDAARISALRAKAVSRLAGKGAMASVALGAAEVGRLLAEQGDAVSIAVINGPGSTVVAGSGEAVRRFVEKLTAAGARARLIPVDYASHSAQIDEIRGEVEPMLVGVSARSGTVRFYSTVTGGPVDTGGLDAEYWWRNLRQPVRFADAARALIEDGFRCFVEASAHPILAPAIQESLDEALSATDRAVVAGSLRRQSGGRDQFLAEVAKAHVAGVAVDWGSCFDGATGRHVDLPTYPFQRKIHRLVPAPRAHGGEQAAGFASRGSGDVAAERRAAGSYDNDGDLFRMDWTPIAGQHQPKSVGSVSVIGQDAVSMCLTLRASGYAAATYPTLRAYADAVRTGTPASDFVLAACPAARPEPAPNPVSDAHAAADWALGTVREFLADRELTGSRLVVVTHLAVSCDLSERAAGFPEATVWGLARSAQSEHPGRVVLIDLDHSDVSAGAIPAALVTREPQLAIRDGLIRVPRLMPARPDGLTPPGRPEPPAAGTFLITGGTGSLGGQVARHLIIAHGVRHLLLTSRQGAAAPGAGKLAAELRGLGAEVRVAACDVTDPGAVESLVGSIPAEHPLTGILHAAGQLDNRLTEGMTTERLHAVLKPKIEGTWNLYRATRDLGICTFVLFSSVAATFGLPGQGNYAAANSFLDSMAAHMRGEGIPAVALAWGTWASRSGLIELTPHEHARLARNAGLLPLDPKNALRLLDRATGSAYPPLLVAARLDGAALRAQEENGTLRPLQEPLVPERGAAPPDSLTGPAAVPAPRQEPVSPWTGDIRAALELVTTEAAVILGHSASQDIKTGHTFKELGFDSLSSLELSHRLATSTGLKLPPTLTYDYPTPAAVAEMLQSKTSTGALA